MGGLVESLQAAAPSIVAWLSLLEPAALYSTHTGQSNRNTTPCPHRVLQAAIPIWRLQVFFCKYNDPLYVKMEKLEIMIKLASEKNIDQVRTCTCACLDRTAATSCHF